jgi:hypothetical protein
MRQNIQKWNFAQLNISLNYLAHNNKDLCFIIINKVPAPTVRNVLFVLPETEQNVNKHQRTK